MAVIVAGVDGSPSAMNAAVWAAREAQRRGDTVRLIYAYIVPAGSYPAFVASAPKVREGIEQQAQTALDAARTEVRQQVPDVEIEAQRVEGQPAHVLAGESRTARCVVVGSRGLGGFTGMLVGSVAVSLSAHARCPVAVVRGKRHDDPPPAQGPVVVGVDGSEHTETALAYAFDAAAERGVPLQAVHSWNDVISVEGPYAYPFPTDLSELEKAGRTLLEETLAPWRERHPEVEVHEVLEPGRPVRTLLQQAEGAQLVVVGTRGHGGFTGMLLGSTSQAMVIHAPCPVVVTRPEESGA
ncbi:universal stress protein [Prauserella rugosa]|uniref:Nucleotide-binding universal stress UspA family protein n=1 Tax=Prauserella rugosa TaxID=43354 RepID=A0A660CD23_9PSEU|nr:universal stress protein [Prauserella rugosa]KMS88129.1 universal stress protein [Streptomyces regensis]TWH19389.1 nucleotide-binding universal stress UspA family protein [Prauserella rugosa]